MKRIMAFLFCLVFFQSTIAQKNATRIPGSTLIGKDTSLYATEVMVSDWMNFIAANNFDTTLFPSFQVISQSLQILFEELRTKEFKYLNVTKTLEKHIVIFEVTPQKAFKSLRDADPFYLSLHNPITGISFEQAKTFCQWKENSLNLVRRQKVKISLPPIELYEKVITNLDSFCRGKCDSCNRYTLNFATPPCFHAGVDKSILSQGKSVLRADAHWPNDYGLYCIQGNAAEMTSSKGIAKGGSFQHFARESYNDMQQSYNKPENWLGFRYMITIE